MIFHFWTFHSAKESIRAIISLGTNRQKISLVVNLHYLFERRFMVFCFLLSVGSNREIPWTPLSFNHLIDKLLFAGFSSTFRDCFSGFRFPRACAAGTFRSLTPLPIWVYHQTSQARRPRIQRHLGEGPTRGAIS